MKPLDFATPSYHFIAPDKPDLTLQEAAERLSIVPIPYMDLLAYKRSEEQKYPASRLLKYQTEISNFCLGGFLMSACVGIIACISLIVLGAFRHMSLNGALIILTIATGSFLMTYLFTVIEDIGIKTQAKWIESDGWKASTPKPINDLIRQILALVPDATVVTGTLIQDMVPLDPYSLLKRGQERLVLGIWDDSGIIRIAEH